MEKNVELVDEEEQIAESQRRGETYCNQQSQIKRQPQIVDGAKEMGEAVLKNAVGTSEPLITNTASVQNIDIRRELDRRMTQVLAVRRELEIECDRVSVERLVLQKLAQSIDSKLSSLQEQDLLVSSTDNVNE